MPFSVSDCGLSLALSPMLIVAERAPRAVGVKVTRMPQLLPGARGRLVQLLA